MCLLCLLVYLFSFVNYVFQSFPIFVEIFLSYCGKDSFYSLNTSPLSGICIVNIVLVCGLAFS